VIAVDAAVRDADAAIVIVVVRAADVVLGDVALVAAAVREVPAVRAADVVISAVRVKVVLRVPKVPRPAPVRVVAVENSAVAIAIGVRAAVPVVPVVLVRAVPAPKVPTNSSMHLDRTPVASSVLRSRRASAPTDSLCRRAASVRASRSDPTQMASDPTESPGIPSVVRSVRPSGKRR
jgi:hypothetical protein